MNYPIESIADFTGAKAEIAIPGSSVTRVIIDHRDIHWNSALFVAFKGRKFDGHSFIQELIERGVRNFLVSDAQTVKDHRGEANFILCDNVIAAVQAIAHEHRLAHNIPIFGIAGSNGKTIVKEWLNHLLEERHQICRSPKSYNSQIGAALSVMQLGAQHTLGIFEAGISQPGEMSKLKNVLEPSYGIFTNLGDAHAAHFESAEDKLEEKMLLFNQCDRIVCCMDQYWFDDYDSDLKSKFFTWSTEDSSADVFVVNSQIRSGTTIIELAHRDRPYTLQFPFEDRASIENAIHCFCACALLDSLSDEVLSKFNSLAPVAMRMEMKRGIENSVIIDDSYNSDLGSLQAALDQLAVQKAESRMLILTDMYQNTGNEMLYQEISEQLNMSRINEVVLIGPEIGKHRAKFSQEHVVHYSNVETFLLDLKPGQFRDKAILVKGARAFKLEKVVQRLQAKQHETTLEVDLHKLGKNLEFFRSRIKPDTKIMVMVKAFSYGSGGYEIASYLQSQKVDYLSVAYADEGVTLRSKGIRLPIMVMSPTKSAFESIIRNQLEPELYSLRSIREFVETAASLRHLFHELNVHLKLDSGMHRLGFQQEDITELLQLLSENPFIRVRSAFTHLSAADSEEDDDFSHGQVERFNRMFDQISAGLPYELFKHVLNSTGILRLPEYHYDMVRIGIGLYGFAGSEHSKYLQALGEFKSYIVQIRTVSSQESVGYNRAGVADTNRRIATVAVGYADGLDRRLGRGNWSIKWRDHACPIVGDVCMDMCMIDVTGCNAQEGDEVVVFSGSKDVEQMAKLLNTIPYEVLTKISQRVNRVYLQE